MPCIFRKSGIPGADLPWASRLGFPLGFPAAFIGRIGEMKVTRIYTGADNESHFEDIEIDLKDLGMIGRISTLQPATGRGEWEGAARRHGWVGSIAGQQTGATRGWCCS